MPYREGKNWRGKVTHKGQRYTSLHSTKSAALAWESEKRKGLKAAKTLHEGLDLLIFCSKYRIYAKRFSRKNYVEKKKLIKRLLRKWGGTMLVEDISSDMLLSYLQEQRTARSPNAANKDRKHILAMWNFGKKFVGIRDNPVSVIDKFSHDRSVQYTPPSEDVLKVLAAADRNQSVLLLAYIYTGARRSEIFRWTWVEDINLEKKAYRLGTKKTRDGSMSHEWFPMPEELHAELSWWWQNRTFKDSPYVFTDDQPGPHYGKPHTTRRRLMAGLCKRAKVKPFGFHALRRFFASRLADLGKSTNTIRRMLRHKNVATTERYIQNINNDLKGVTSGILGEKGTKAGHENEGGHADAGATP
jgi:integrase